MADVYISCNPRDAAAAQHIRNDLESMNISCVISSVDNPSGVYAADVLPEAIAQATFFVVLVSRSALSSSVVKNELYWATEANRFILPVRLDNKPLNDTFNFYLGTSQWITVKRRLSAASKELADLIYAELHPTTQKTVNEAEEKADAILKENKAIFIRVAFCILICTAFLIASAVSFALLRKSDLKLYWELDNIIKFVVIVAVFIATAPLFGGYKTFLRTVLEELWDALRGV